MNKVSIYRIRVQVSTSEHDTAQLLFENLQEVIRAPVAKGKATLNECSISLEEHKEGDR